MRYLKRYVKQIKDTAGNAPPEALELAHHINVALAVYKELKHYTKMGAGRDGNAYANGLIRVCRKFERKDEGK